MNKDTPQQRIALRRNKTARLVRAQFPEGTRVQGAPGVFGTVIRHVPGFSADGGTLVIRWDSGTEGRVTALNTGISRVVPDDNQPD